MEKSQVKVDIDAVATSNIGFQGPVYEYTPKYASELALAAKNPSDFSVRPDDTPDKILVQDEWVKGVSKAAATDEASLMSDSKVVAERFAMVRETDLKGATALPTTATKDLVNAYLMRGETIVTSIDVIAFNNVNGKSMVGRQGVLFITASSQGHHKVKVIMMSETNQVNISESGTRKQSYMGGTEQNLLKQVSTKHTLDGFFSTIDLSKNSLYHVHLTTADLAEAAAKFNGESFKKSDWKASGSSASGWCCCDPSWCLSLCPSWSCPAYRCPAFRCPPWPRCTFKCALQCCSFKWCSFKWCSFKCCSSTKKSVTPLFPIGRSGAYNFLASTESIPELDKIVTTYDEERMDSKVVAGETVPLKAFEDLNVTAKSGKLTQSVRELKLVYKASYTATIEEASVVIAPWVPITDAIDFASQLETHIASCANESTYKRDSKTMPNFFSGLGKKNVEKKFGMAESSWPFTWPFN